MISFTRRKALKAFGLVVGAAALSQTPLPLKAATLLSAFDDRSYFRQSFTGILIGAGKRGNKFGNFSLNTTGRLSLVGVAETQDARRHAFAEHHQLPAERCFAHWEQVFEQPRFAEVVLLTASRDYTVLCAAALRAGYDVWTDKPVALDKAKEADLLALAKSLGRRIVFCYIYDKQFLLQEYAPRYLSQITSAPDLVIGRAGN